MRNLISQLSHPVDVNGNVVDASFMVDSHGDGYSMFFASRGGTVGTSGARNSEYHVGLRLLLHRLSGLDASVTDLLLDSVPARRSPLVERRLPIPRELPIRLRDIEDIDQLRLMISEAQRSVLVASDRNPKHGNRVRSIRINFTLPGFELNTDELTAHLVGKELVASTADKKLLEVRAARLRRGILRERPLGNAVPQRTISPQTERHLRLPSVVAYVIARANEHCELCGIAGFITDSGDAFLEVHHVVWLANGGPDTTDNAVALCAACHRELHYGVRRRELSRLLYEKVPELAVPGLPNPIRKASS